MKQLLILAIYVTFWSVILLWRVETLPTRLEQTLQTVSNQMAIADKCVDENDFYNETEGN